MTIRPGPSGIKHLLSEQVPGDQGGLFATLDRVSGHRAMIMDFGKPVTFVTTDEKAAIALVASIRKKVTDWFGPMTYNANELATYVTCSALPHVNMVKVEFLPPSMVGYQGVLAANPEVFLALAENIEKALESLVRDRGWETGTPVASFS